MAAVFDAVSSAANGSAGGTLSWSHVLGNLGSTGLIVVIAEGERTTGGSTDQNITGITFNGVAMTAVNSDSRTDADSVSAAMYELHGASVPAAGTYTVTVSYANTNVNSRVGGAMSFSGVKDQIKEASATQTGQGTSPFSQSITTLTANALVIVGYGNQNALGNPSYSTGETTGFDKTVGSVEDSLCSGAYKTVSTPGATSTSFTVTNPQSEVLLLASFEIAPQTTSESNYSFLM